MADTIKPGTILITEGALLSESLLLESEPYGYGWRLVKNLDSSGLDKIIGQAGWDFFVTWPVRLRRTRSVPTKKDYSQGDQEDHRESEIEEL